MKRLKAGESFLCECGATHTLDNMITARWNFRSCIHCADCGRMWSIKRGLLKLEGGEK